MENSTEPRKIEIEEDILKDLDKTSKWTMFHAILGFIFVGIMVIIGLCAGVFLSVFNSGDASSVFPDWLVFVIILIFAVIYFFPGLYLFRFSKHTSNAVKTLNRQELHKAFKNLKTYYIYIGILLITFLIIYVAAFIASGASIEFLKDLG